MKRLLFVLMIVGLLASSAAAQEVIIEPANYLFNADSGKVFINPDCFNNFEVRIINNGVREGGFGMGFQIYSSSGTMTPVHFDTVASDNFEYTWGEMFGLLISVQNTNVDGIGRDTVGMLTAAFPTDVGLPVGFNEVVATIETGGIPEGDSICIDSSFVPTSTFWKWGSGAIPTWNGPYCFQALSAGCCNPGFTNIPDTIFIEDCHLATHYFDFSPCIGGTGVVILDGAGVMESPSHYTLDTETDGFTNTVTFGKYEIWCDCYNILDTVEVTIAYRPGFSNEPGDVDQNCQFDVTDLLMLVDYMFDPEPPIIDITLADCDGSGQLDISDLLRMVDYMFGDGPGCVPPVE